MTECIELEIFKGKDSDSLLKVVRGELSIQDCASFYKPLNKIEWGCETMVNGEIYTLG